MRLSVVIPVYNAEKYIETCLNSIIPQLTEDDEIQKTIQKQYAINM